MALVFCVDACHALQLVNVTRGLLRSGARPIYRFGIERERDVDIDVYRCIDRYR